MPADDEQDPAGSTASDKVMAAAGLAVAAILAAISIDLLRGSRPAAVNGDHDD